MKQTTTPSTFAAGAANGTHVPAPSRTYSMPSAAPAIDALALYTRRIAEVDLLTRQEEIDLARRVRKGDQAARERMICANLRLVIKIAREYENLGLPLLDLINEGNLGLMKAVDRFDPDRGAKFSTYAVWWIKQRIRRSLSDQGKTIRVPVNAMDQIYQLRKAGVKLRDQLGRDASDDELAGEVGISGRRVKALREANSRPCSLDSLLGDEDSHSFADIIPDESASDPSQASEVKESLSLLPDLLHQLPDREMRIIQERFGLKDGRERTLEDIGARLGVTRERIRQLQNLALNRLRGMMERPSEVGVAA